MHAEIKNINVSDASRDKATQIIESCVHCGFCLATCPTYQLLAMNWTHLEEGFI